MKPISPYSISAPGFYGLNLSDSPSDMPPGFALQADNCIIDRSGRIASRKGWVKTATTDVTTDVTCIGEVIENSGTATTVCTANGKLYKLTSTTLTELTYGGGGVAPTISTNNWIFTQLNGVGMFWQRGYDPLIYDPAISTTTYRRLNEKVGTTGTVRQANVAISAYGRVWCADLTTDKNTVYFSDLLTPHIWTAGSSGSLNLIGVWPDGGDEIVGFAAYNNALIIFGRHQILVYGGATTPSTMALTDTIVGIGCIARDSIQPTGEDVWFLSDTGLRSIKRTIQEKSAPMRQISKNVHNDLQQYIDIENNELIKSGYSAVNNFYLLVLPIAERTYCFDTRGEMQDGSSRTTTWSTTFSSFYETKDRNFYFGKPGYLGTYSGYSDNLEHYRINYYSTWIDFGNPLIKSILKKIRATVICNSTQSLVLKWAYDFSTIYSSESVIVISDGVPSEYGIAEFNVAEYSGSLEGINVISVNGSGSGQLLQFGIEIESNGTLVSIQKIDILTKDGRL